MDQQLLVEILAELKKLNNPQSLGLLDAGMKIYANRHNPPHLWYTIASDRATVVGIPQTAVRGFVKDLKIEGRERRGKDVEKLLIRLQGDKSYVIESGVGSNFSKGLVAALAALAPSQLKSPITIAVKAGDEESVLFCSVYSCDGLVVSPYKDADCQALFNRAVANVEFANRKESGLLCDGFTPIDQIRQMLALADSLSAVATIEALWGQNRTGTPVDDEIDLAFSEAKVRFSYAETPAPEAFTAIAGEMLRIGWSAKDGSQYLKEAYGKRSRADLTPSETASFLAYLKEYPAQPDRTPRPVTA